MPKLGPPHNRSNSARTMIGAERDARRKRKYSRFGANPIAPPAALIGSENASCSLFDEFDRGTR
ncbi:MAG: hypothetical protein KGM15_03565 [Pseudomonadota bacterium]|nr:hypothetical protein [Pseudomonadota bacterium]